MDVVVLENIPFQPDFEKLKKKFRIKEGSSWGPQVERLAREAEAIARPRAMYGEAFVDLVSDREVMVEGTSFNSRVLRVNLENTHRVFPFVVTCGLELHDWAASQEELLPRYYADEIAEEALREALTVLESHLEERFKLGRTATMNPGSLPDWPIQAQRSLFSLFGGAAEDLGVRLTDSMLMVPSKSVSGFLFPTEKSFASCQLCSRDRCPSRRAIYNPDLFDEKYQGAQSEFVLGAARE
jgi:hypothetical protein